ncbi:hypothetical protein [Paractinoplanes rishiriensis]|uniref:Uncharacterized protein n=1 Tax=Paractinoplanes rishiriensis TaxID=1050105 RepID=A0A919JZT4_9ACTN|nr:hypothetical protein [Actinoplanes rishiriensis]GIE96475.1 hypothetical protein Ari01nite_39400 [Actinoplanes rishiriensis]
MSRQFRYRVTAMVLGGLIFGAPLLTNGTASAEQTEPVAEGGRQVVFEGGGGMFGLSCRSRPDVESMVVPAESTVRVVNRTGYSAKLMLSGDTKGVLPDDAVTEVVFRRGTTSVLLEPNCALGDDAMPVMVTASPSAGVLPDPAPATAATAERPSSAPSAADSPSGPASGAVLPDSAPASRPHRVLSTGTTGTRGPVVLRTSAVAQAATTAAQAMPQGSGTSRVKTRTQPRTTGGTLPAFAGMPPGEQKKLLPGVPPLDATPATQEAAPGAVSPEPSEIAAAEPVAAMRPMPDSTPIGLLALIAAVCVMGVGAAAIRAIVSERANRAKMA